MAHYSLEKKIEVLGDMIDRLNMLVTLIEDEDVEAADQADEASKVLSAIKSEYEERHSKLYEEVDE